MKAIVNNVEFEIRSTEGLNNLFRYIEEEDLAEVWLSKISDVSSGSLAALINSARAALSYFRSEYDTGFSSRSNSGLDESKISFVKSNGQEDEYSLSWTVTTTDAFKAFQYFFEKGERTPWIIWHDDNS